MIELTSETDRVHLVNQYINEFINLLDNSVFYPGFSQFQNIIIPLFDLLCPDELVTIFNFTSCDNVLLALAALPDLISLKFISKLNPELRKVLFIDLVKQNNLEAAKQLWDSQIWEVKSFSEFPNPMQQLVKYYHLYKMTYWLYSIGFRFDSLCYNYAEVKLVHNKVRNLMNKQKEGELNVNNSRSSS